MRESKSMRIGIDISQIVYKGTGVARFTDGLTNAILDFDRSNSWVFFFSSLRKNLDPEIEKKIFRKGHKLIKWKLPPTLLSLLFNDFHNFSKLLTCLPAGRLLTPFLTSLDWFITSDWTEPPLLVNKVTIVHDLVYLRYPETVDSKVLATQRKRLLLVKRESRVIFADSNATKQDLIDLLHIDPKKIHVNYPGVDVKKPNKEQIKLTLKKYNLNRPFVLTVGKLEPRKNLKRLIEAMKQLNNLPAGRQAETIDLIIVGPKGWLSNSQQFTVNNQLSNIKFLGLVSDTELSSLYSSCLFFIYPSLWEGFGYPVVEAMKLGAAVATSDTSSLSEIAKGAALLFDPFNVKDMYKCIYTLIHSERLRSELAEKGQKKSKTYTWKTYYNRLIQLLYDNRS